MESETHTVRPTGADALGAVATQHILDRLKEAVRVAEQDLPNNLEQFRELLEGVSDQTDAWVLTRVADQLTESDRPASRLEYSMLARPDGDPVEEFLLIPFGEVRIERPMAGTSFVFTPRHAESAKRWFEQMGRKLAIDYEHQSFDRYNTRPDRLRPAAGWIGRLEVRDDGLWACDVMWTDRAQELLKSGEYRYFSPVIFWTDEDYSDIAALGPVALTNDPAMRGVRPLAARRCDPSQVHAIEDATSGVQHAAEDVGSESESEAVLRGELDAAKEEIALLRTQLLAQEADAFVERGMRLGKILDSTSMDWREDYLRGPERTAERLERAPVLLPPGRVIKLDARGTVVRGESELKRSEETPGRPAIDPEDLAAYDRALAAGRIRRSGVPPQP
ncbi:MAG: phage protease [Phycisphaerae bacterium]